MRKTRSAVKGVLFCSISALLLTSLSSSQASFSNSANTSITASAATASSSIVNNGEWATYPEPLNRVHVWTSKIPLNGSTYVRGHNYTATNTGSTDQYLSLKTDLTIPNNPNLPRSALTMNHTNVKVFVGNTEVYSGLLSQINSTPILVKAKASITYRIDILGFYTTALDNSRPAEAWTGVPIKVRMSPSPNSQSSWDQISERYVWHALSDFKIRSDDLTVEQGSYDGNCVFINWHNNWKYNGPAYTNFTVQYSRNSNMSSPTVVDVSGDTRVKLEKLYPNTTYYYRVLVKNGFKEVWSPTMSVTTRNSDGKPNNDICPSP